MGAYGDAMNETIIVDGLTVEFEVEEYTEHYGADADGNRGISYDAIEIDWDSVTVDGVPIDKWKPTEGDYADWTEADYKEYRNYILEEIERKV